MADKPYDNAILNEREATHGDYAVTARVSQQLKRVIHGNLSERGVVIPFTHSESLDLICTKIARLVAGDLNCVDTWDDIAGYAELIASGIRRKTQSDVPRH